MFSEHTINGDLNLFRDRILNFINSFQDAVFLDSNTGRTGPVPVTGVKYDFLAAAGVNEMITLSGEQAINYSSADNHDNVPADLLLLQDFIQRQRKSGNWIFGFLSYDLKNQLENLVSSNIDHAGFPLYHFFTANHVFIARDNILTIRSASDPVQLWQDISGETDQTADGTEVPRISHMLDRDIYTRGVNKLLDHIQQGDVYEVNYCHQVLATVPRLDALAVYRRLNSISPNPFSCYYRTGGSHLICSSPERFITKRNDVLIAQPIKGTAARGMDAFEDKLNREHLAHSEKERSENIMIVDLVRNDLSRIALPGTVEVDELCGIYTFPKVHQMISTITCKVKRDIPFIDVIRSLFPMGSMTGAPKISAMKLIDEVENFSRSLYSGTAGYIDPDGDFDFNVVIRSILYNENTGTVSFAAGGAITAASNSEQEYNETIVKLAPQFEALGMNSKIYQTD